MIHVDGIAAAIARPGCQPQVAALAVEIFTFQPDGIHTRGQSG
jgi:hypothetical protein